MFRHLLIWCTSLTEIKVNDVASKNSFEIIEKIKFKHFFHKNIQIIYHRHNRKGAY